MLGIFDSGLGGLTILKKIHARLPSLSTAYLGDNARAPYGTRTHEEIFTFALEGVRELFARGCPLVILACNTASAQALRHIQQTILPAEFPDRRVLGVIRPTAEELVSLSPGGHVGVLATPATVQSGAYLRELRDIRGDLAVSQAACPGRFTELIEAGLEESNEAAALAAACCGELMARDPDIDTVLLGCTHYPIAGRVFRDALPARVRIVTQGAIVADRLADYLARHPDIARRVDATGARAYFTTKDGPLVSTLASRFYGAPLRFQSIR